MQGGNGTLPFVLIVEDDPDITELLRNVLGDTYVSELLGDVPSALAFLDRRCPDVILLDCVLPGGGITEILRKARTLRCTVVLMSGLPDILAELAAFGYPCLQKPFRMAELMNALSMACIPRVPLA